MEDNEVRALIRGGTTGLACIKVSRTLRPWVSFFMIYAQETRAPDA